MNPNVRRSAYLINPHPKLYQGVRHRSDCRCAVSSLCRIKLLYGLHAMTVEMTVDRVDVPPVDREPRQGEMIQVRGGGQLGLFG